MTSLAQDRDGVDVRIETPHGQRALRAAFVVGCDGGASTTRDLIGARLVGSTYAERWLVVDALIDNHDVDTITFFCDPRRPTVRLPAVGSRVRFEFMQLPGENSDELASDHRIKEFLQPSSITHVSTSNAASSTPSTPASPTLGVRAVCSSPATPRI